MGTATKARKPATASAATVGYEAKLWRMADVLRGSMDAAEYKHVVLGLVFLKYIPDAFEEQHAKLFNIKVGDETSHAKDVLGRVFENFLSQFASAEGKKGGEFYIPRCVVKLLVEILEPYRSRVYDRCCGSFPHDGHPDRKADCILADPPLNVSDCGGDRLRDDKRRRCGVPPASNANFACVAQR